MGSNTRTSNWIAGLPASAQQSAQIAGAAPFQEFVASEVPQSHWFGSGNLIVRHVVIACVLLVVGPLTGFVITDVSWTRRRTRVTGGIDHPLGVLLIGLAGASVLTAAGLVTYLIMIARLALEYEQDPWLVQGGWIGIRIMGLVATVFGALAINDLADRRAGRGAGSDARTRPPIATGVAAHLTAWTVPVGCVLLLVILAYWGVFQLGI